jgi:hypothetical protein
MSQSTSPNLSWEAVTSAASYNVLVSTVSTFASTAWSQTGLTGVSASVSGLANNTGYFWKASATNAGGTSPWSSVWSFTTTGPLVAGTWYGIATVVTTQVDNPDTFSTRISITGNNYVMMRSTYIHASSTGNQDTMMEYGTVSSVPAGYANGDSIIFTPDSNSEYMFNTGLWETCTGLYCPVATPERFKINIKDSAGGTNWDDSFPDFKGEGWYLTYLKKQ